MTFARASFALSAPLLAFLLVTTLGATGCQNRGRSRAMTSDGGTTMRTDGGTTTGRDGGIIVMFDGGMTVRDGGTTGCTSSSECPSGQECSVGRCVPISMTCRSQVIDAVPGAYCAAATTTCAEACADGACIESCLMGDPSPDCWACANQNIIACIVDAGCQSQWDCVASCIEDNCPTGSADTCPDTYCSTELDAWGTCSDTFGTSCGTSWTTCLP